jgi:hypothetical protein
MTMVRGGGRRSRARLHESIARLGDAVLVRRVQR